MNYMKDLMEAKYHLSIAKRMIESYEQYSEKRILVGVINESAKATSSLIRAFLIKEKTKGDFDVFLKKITPKYLDKKTTENITKILEIEKAQKISKIEFAKKNKIILLADGKYRILTLERIKEFVKSINEAISNFPTDIKR